MHYAVWPECGHGNICSGLVAFFEINPKGPCLDNNKSLHLSGMQKKHTPTVTTRPFATVLYGSSNRPHYIITSICLLVQTKLTKSKEIKLIDPLINQSIHYRMSAIYDINYQ